jgi:hypothetical protein
MTPPTPETVDAAHHNDNQRRLMALETAMSANTAVTERLAVDTQELLDLFRAAKGGFRVVGWIGTFAKWSAGLAAAAVALYTAFQNMRGH